MAPMLLKNLLESIITVAEIGKHEINDDSLCPGRGEPFDQYGPHGARPREVFPQRIQHWVRFRFGWEDVLSVRWPVDTDQDQSWIGWHFTAHPEKPVLHIVLRIDERRKAERVGGQDDQRGQRTDPDKSGRTAL